MILGDNPEYQHIYTKYWGIIDRVMSFGFLLAINTALIVALMMLVFPHHRTYWWFLLISAKSVHYFVMPLFCVIEFLQILFLWIALIAHIYLRTFYIICIINALNVLNM